VAMISVRSIALVHARALWRRRWYAAGVAWLVCLAGWAFVMHLPNEYEAKARVYIDADSMLRPLMAGIAFDSNILSQVDLMQRTLLSTPNLQKVSHAADLDLAARSPTDSQEVVNDLRRRITVTGEGRNLFSLAYTGPSKQISTKIVQSLLQVFVESNLGNSRQDMASTRAFIDAQLRDYSQQLDQAEQRVADFKAKNRGYLPGDDNFYNKLDMAKQQLEATQATLQEKRQERDAMAKQLAALPETIDTVSDGSGMFGAGPPVGGGSAGPSIAASAGGAGADLAAANQRVAETNARVSELERKLDSLLENYTPQHPDVVNIKRLLTLAKQEQSDAKRVQREKAAHIPRATRDSRATRSTGPNPIYGQLQLQLADLETNIASLEARAKHDQADVDKWQALAKTLPEVATQMSKLTRGYNTIKNDYDQLLSRREAVKMGSDMESQTQTVQFRIIDPPIASTEPVAPKRRLLLSVVLLGGIAAGAAFAFLLAQIDDTVMNVRQLKELIAVPVLGAISLVSNASRTGRQRIGLAGFVAVCAGLIVAYLGVISIGTLVGLGV